MHIHAPHRRVLTAAIALTALSLSITACAPPADETAATGGTLTVAAPGSNNDSIDANINSGSQIDLIRTRQLYNNLTQLNSQGDLEYELAESMEPNADATVWTIHLRDGVTFHDGTDFGADDVIATIERIVAEDSTANGKSLLSFLDPAGLVAVDDLTVEVTLEAPYGPFPEVWTNKYLPIVSTDYDPSEPVGTGPFSYVSFTPGQSSTFERYDAYWGEPAKVDTLKIVDFQDNQAAINALRGGQVDIVNSVPLSEVASLESADGINVLRSPSTSYINLAMNTQVAPFDDERVREAFRLIVDRQGMVDNALNGYGIVGNDYIGGMATCQPDVAQRTQDLDRAKSLLQESGHENLTVSLATTNGTVGMVEAAEVFAEQAKGAGVTVEVQNLDVTAYLNRYLEWDFAVDFFSDDYLQVASRTLLPGGASNETHWEDPEFVSLASDVFAEQDAEARCDIQKQMKTVEYQNGGNIIWGYYDVVNAYSDAVSGLEEDVTGKAVYRLAEVSVTR